MSDPAAAALTPREGVGDDIGTGAEETGGARLTMKLSLSL